MLDIIKISIVFITILVFLRLKWGVGYVLLIASGLLATLYLMPLPAVASTVRAAIIDPISIKLFFALTLIKTLELVLREKQVLSRMMDASRNMLKQKKAVIISMPLFIGLLPSLGGAYFSAPMVGEATKDLKMSPEEKSFINYWFRHPWEYILPLYPGILLASAITKIGLRELIFANLAYAILIFVTGFLFSMRDISSEANSRWVTTRKHGRAEALKSGSTEAKKQAIKTSDLMSFLPVFFIIFLVIFFNIELHYALGTTLMLLFIYYRFSPKEIFRVVKYGFTPDVVVLIFGAMLFKFTMETSGAVSHLSSYFADTGIPVLPVIIILPFVSGLLTGLTVGFVGSTFPLIISLAGGIHLNEITLAFASGFIGVLMSPVHLCFVLTREYFKADAWGIYKKTIPASVIIMIAALAEYFILR